MINLTHSDILNDPPIISRLVYVLHMIVMHKKDTKAPWIAYKYLEMDMHIRKGNTYTSYACLCKNALGAKYC